MIRPTPYLKDLIAKATPQQAARAIRKAKEYSLICGRLGVEMAPAEKVLSEALELEINGEADVDGERTAVYDKRSYTHYQEQ